MADLPESERREAWTINLALNALEKEAANFESALLVYDALKSIPHEIFDTSESLVLVPLRDGAATLYRVKCLINSVCRSIKTLAAFREYVDLQLKEEAEEDFRSAFPQVFDVRQSVTYAEALFGAQSLTQKQATRGNFTEPNSSCKDSPVTIAAYFLCEQCTSTSKRKVISYELTKDSVSKLNSVAEKFLSAFPKPPVVLGESQG